MSYLVWHMFKLNWYSGLKQKMFVNSQKILGCESSNFKFMSEPKSLLTL